VTTVTLVALDVAILPPPDVAARAIALSAALPARPGSRGPGDTGSERLVLDGDHLPHVTLTQHFVHARELELALSHVDAVLATQPPLPLVVTGGGRSGQTLWMSVKRTPDLFNLHERLMDALRGLERQGGGPRAFYDGDGRVRDVLWVGGFRLKAGGSAFTPHITLGHGPEVPAIEPFAFEATTVAACHLGRFCTCRRVLRAWTLKRA
jgi:hypothetical protein